MMRAYLIVISVVAFLPFVFINRIVTNLVAAFHIRPPAIIGLLLKQPILILLMSLLLGAILLLGRKSDSEDRSDSATIIGIYVCSQLCLFSWLAFVYIDMFLEINKQLS